MRFLPRRKVDRWAVSILRSQTSGYKSPRHFIAAQQHLGVRCISKGDAAEQTNKPGESRGALDQKPEGIKEPLVSIDGGEFFREHPSTGPTTEQDPLSRPNPPLFENKTFFTLASAETGTDTRGKRRKQTWCIIGPSRSGKTSFLQMLRGELICMPPEARRFHPLIDQKSIRYAGFDTAHRGGGLGKLASSYLAERYESRQEGANFTLRDYLLDNTELNPLSTNTLDSEAEKLLSEIVDGLDLGPLLDLPVIFLSNGQTRRAMIAHALLHRPRLLLLDEPFMGLDPPTVVKLSAMLRSFARKAAPLAEEGKQSPSLVLTARPQDPLPYWITNVVFLRRRKIIATGDVDGAFRELKRSNIQHVLKNGTVRLEPATNLLRGLGQIIGRHSIRQVPKYTAHSKFGENKMEPIKGGSAKPIVPIGEPVVEMDGCLVKYGEKSVLGGWQEQQQGAQRSGLHWTVRRGERWGVFGPNGSGKTTLVSLLCSDHPQTYSLPIKLFGRSRLPDPNSDESPLTFWDIQARIGHSSPEVHQHMPRGLSVRQVLESAWADTFRSKPKLDEWAVGQIDATLEWFSPEINPAHVPAIKKRGKMPLAWADSWLFGELPFTAQRVLLFLRAIVKHPDIVVLDESFGGMDEKVRDKCMTWLENGNTWAAEKTKHQKDKTAQIVEGLQDRQALICISHVQDEVPDCVTKWMCLPEGRTGNPARFGSLEEPLRRGNLADWNRIWGLAEERRKTPSVPAYVVSWLQRHGPSRGVDKGAIVSGTSEAQTQENPEENSKSEI